MRRQNSEVLRPLVLLNLAESIGSPNEMECKKGSEILLIYGRTFSNNLPVFLSSVKILNGELNRFSSFDYVFKASPDQQLWFMKLNFTIITIIINNEAHNHFISTS